MQGLSPRLRKTPTCIKTHRERWLVCAQFFNSFGYSGQLLSFMDDPKNKHDLLACHQWVSFQRSIREGTHSPTNKVKVILVLCHLSAPYLQISFVMLV